jgi:hypothetical protein
MWEETGVLRELLTQLRRGSERNRSVTWACGDTEGPPHGEDCVSSRWVESGMRRTSEMTAHEGSCGSSSGPADLKIDDEASAAGGLGQLCEESGACERRSRRHSAFRRTLYGPPFRQHPTIGRVIRKDADPRDMAGGGEDEGNERFEHLAPPRPRSAFALSLSPPTIP